MAEIQNSAWYHSRCIKSSNPQFRNYSKGRRQGIILHRDFPKSMLYYPLFLEHPVGKDARITKEVLLVNNGTFGGEKATLESIIISRGR